MDLVISNVRILLEGDEIDRGWLAVDAGKISAFNAGDVPPEFAEVDEIDGQKLTLAAGFVDIHVHGAMGHEAMDADPDALIAMAQFYAQHGVTSFLPTTWTANHAQIMAALAAITEMVGVDSGGAQIIGAHVEGPYLNPAKSGAQDPAVIRRATQAEIREILETGVVRLLALAPEYLENRAIIPLCREYGVKVSAAHTDATYDDLRAAVGLGLTQTTHTYNAMRGLHHREPGMVGGALTIDALYCEVIPDDNHLHPAVIDLLWRVKGRDKTVIITDAVRGTGLDDGRTYLQDGREVRIQRGAARLPDGTLAGSILTMDEAVQNFIDATRAPLTDALRCASLIPARAIGMDHRKGSIAPGKDADLILFDADLNIYLTMVNGEVVHASAT